MVFLLIPVMKVYDFGIIMIMQTVHRYKKTEGMYRELSAIHSLCLFIPVLIYRLQSRFSS